MRFILGDVPSTYNHRLAGQAGLLSIISMRFTGRRVLQSQPEWWRLADPVDRGASYFYNEAGGGAGVSKMVDPFPFSNTPVQIFIRM